MTPALRAAVIGCIALGVAGARAAGAQADLGTGAVSGYVVDAGGHPIRGARVLVLGTPRLTLTGAQGEYRLDSVPAGDRLVRVRAARFAPLDLRLAVPRADIADLDVRLDSAPPAADTSAPPDAPDLLKRAAAKPDFEFFVTRSEIDQHPARTLTQYLRGHGWVVARDGSAWSPPTTSSHAVAERIAIIPTEDLYRLQASPAARGATFPPRDECGHAWPVILDGFPLEPPYRLDDIPVSAVSALEVRVPVAHVVEHPDLGNSPACGLVFVYTR